MANQTHGANFIREPANSGAVPASTEMIWKIDPVSGKWSVFAGLAAQATGKWVDLYGTGKYVLIDMRNEYVLANVGAGPKVTPTLGGTETAVVALVGSKYVAVALGAGTKAAQWLLDCVRSKLRLVPYAAPTLKWVKTRNKVVSY